MKKAIERGDKVRDREQLEFVDASYDHIVIRIRSSSGDSKNPVVTVTGTSTSISSSKGKLQRKYETKSDATRAYERAKEMHKLAIQEWEHGGRDRARDLGRKVNEHLHDGTRKSEDEIEDEVKLKEYELKSVSDSLSGTIVTSTYKSYMTAYLKRHWKERMKSARGKFDIKRMGLDFFSVFN